MKNTIKIYAAIFMIIGLWSCENEENFLILEPQEAAFGIITPDEGTAIVLNESTATNTALTLTWEKMNYGTPTEITYTVQFATNGSDFETPLDISSANTTRYTMTVSDLNAKALELGLVPDAQGAIDVRIKSTVGTAGSDEKFSSPITILVTPYNTIIPEREMFLVGIATSAGWNPDNNNMPLFRDPVNKDLYTFTGFFRKDGSANSGEFKVIEVKGSYQPQWGQVGGALAGNPGTQSGDPDVFSIPTEGYYTFVMNVANNTYSITPFSVVPSAIPTVGIIGTATDLNFDASTPMQLADPSGNPHIWKISVALRNGELKFRANNAWDLNWGGTTAISGVGSTNNAPNIPVTAGQYDVWFNDIDGRYLLIPIL